MASRLLREGILDSEGVNQLSFPAEVFYRRLMSVVDDFGRFDGRPQVLRSRLYPLKVDTVREADISRWIAECEKAGVIALYAVNRAGSPRWIATCEKAGLSVSGDERPYILFHKLGSPRAKESKFPPPPSDDDTGSREGTDANACAHPFTSENGCKQPPASVPYSGSYSGSGSLIPPNTLSGGTATATDQKPAKAKTRRKRPDADEHPLFARFWSAYPRKAKRTKAAKAFSELDPDEQLLDQMLGALAWQSRSAKWAEDGGRYVPHPTTWLNDRRWEDEPQTGTVASSVPASAADVTRRTLETVEKVGAPAPVWGPMAAKLGGGA